MYGQDLSYIHDAAFGDLSRAVSRILLALLRDGGHVTGVVVDLGCGTGILAGEITNAGFDVIGVDISPSMIAIAQSRLPDASFHVGSLHDFDLPPCVAACGVGETLSYLRPGEARIDVRRLFSRIWHALEPGGTFLFDVVEAGRDEPMSSHACRSGPDWAVEAVVTEDVTRSVITRTITTRRTDGVHVRSTTEVHRVQVFSRTELDEALTGCGFRVEMDGTYRGVSLPPGRVGVIAKRPRR